jgi:hypothetical protein
MLESRLVSNFCAGLKPASELISYFYHHGFTPSRNVVAF